MFTVCVVDAVYVLFQVMSKTNVFTVCVVDAVDVLFQVMSKTNVFTVCVVDAVYVLFQEVVLGNVVNGYQGCFMFSAYSLSVQYIWNDIILWTQKVEFKRVVGSIRYNNKYV